VDATRRARLAAVVQEELSVKIRGLKDPRVPSVTITRVDVTKEGDQATVFFTLLGAALVEDLDDPAHKEAVKECLDGLKSASGFLRRHLASVLTIRHVPTLIFREDRGVQNATRVHELLKKIT
jgi:ribosome-binding factor A